jgi:hypothetical protein
MFRAEVVAHQTRYQISGGKSPEILPVEQQHQLHFPMNDIASTVQVLSEESEDVFSRGN